MSTIKMFGPSLDGSGRLVNRDVSVADELAYMRIGYRRGSIPEVTLVTEPVIEPAEKVIEAKEVKPRKVSK